MCIRDRVLGGIDGKSSGIQKIGGLGFCVSQLLLESRHDLLGQLVRKIGIGVLAFLGHQIHILDPGVDVVGQGQMCIRDRDSSGQNSVGSPPDSPQTVMATWLSLIHI